MFADQTKSRRETHATIASRVRQTTHPGRGTDAIFIATQPVLHPSVDGQQLFSLTVLRSRSGPWAPAPSPSHIVLDPHLELLVSCPAPIHSHQFPSAVTYREEGEDSHNNPGTKVSTSVPRLCSPLPWYLPLLLTPTVHVRAHVSFPAKAVLLQTWQERRQRRSCCFLTPVSQPFFWPSC